MRILLIANTLPPHDLSGVGEQVMQLAAGLRSLGHAVEVMGRGGDGAGGPKLLFPLAAVPAALRRIRALRPHVVQVHESDGALVALAVVALRAGWDPPPRLLALLQVSYLEERRAVRPLRWAGRVIGRPGLVEWRFRWFKAPLHSALGSLTAWLADGVLAPSAATAAELGRDYGVDEVGVLPNATGGGGPEPAAPGRRGHLLFVGRLRLRKGVEVLLHALAELLRSRPGVTLLVAGDGEHRAALERTAASLELGGAVRFLGRCDRARVGELLAGAAALVVPSIYEGMPLVVLEAMAAGVPVVASRVSGIPEVVEDGVHGWLVPPEDPPALAAALGAVLESPAASAARGEAGRQRVREEFNPGAVATRWCRLAGVPETEVGS